MGYDIIEIDTLATIIAIVVGFASLIGTLLHYERRHIRLESRVEGIEKELGNLKPLKDVLNALTTISKNPAIIDLAKHIHPPGVKCNPYDPKEKNRLLDRYQDGTIDIVDAKRLQEMLSEDLELARDNAPGALAVGVLLVGLGTLIERLVGSHGGAA